MKAALELLERKKSRLRGWVLLLLCCMAVCLCLPKEAEPLPDVQTTERGEAALAGMKVALDPGHGGYDGGARARDSGGGKRTSIWKLRWPWKRNWPRRALR